MAEPVRLPAVAPFPHSQDPSYPQVSLPFSQMVDYSRVQGHEATVMHIGIQLVCLPSTWIPPCFSAGSDVITIPPVSLEKSYFPEIKMACFNYIFGDDNFKK